MNAESTAATDDIEPVATTAGTPGELLRDERERRQLSVQQAAEDLHLDVRLVEAIEANNFQALGAPVYAKGHLRKYAALLGLAPELVIASYQTLSDVPPVPTPVPVTAPAPRPRRRGPRLSKPVLAVVGLLIAAAVWWGVSSSRAVPHVQVPAADVSAAPEANVENAAVSTPEDAASTQAEKAGSEVPATSGETDAPAAQAPGKASGDIGNVTMRLEFTAASWSEIYDGAGKRLMFEVGQPGRVRTVSGVAPLKVTLGVAAAASVTVNDRSVAVPRQPGKDATRFVVAADGSVRQP